MTDLTTALAEALRLISFASMDRGARDTATEALRLYDEAKAQPVQDLPPLPDAHWVEEFSHGTLVYTADQMHDYARAALAATPAPAELEKAHEARRQAQSELDYFKARLASARLTLMRELKEQGWAPAPAPLTDEQIDKTAKRVIPVAAYMGMFEYAAFSKEDADRTVRHFARAIERAHGIGASTKESNQ